MATSLTPPDELFIHSLRNSMQAELTKALEPMIQTAIAEIEKDLRKKLGVMVIGLLEKSYSVMQDRQELRITVRKEV